MTDTHPDTQLIILDRDGVINEDSDNYIKSPDEWIPIPGSLAAVARLNSAGYKVAVATNQSGIARGYYDEATLSRMHDKMHGLLAQVGGHVDLIRHCPHGPDDGCDCRKPRPGMLRDILEHFSLQPQQALFVGDSLSDGEAARALGIPFALVISGKGQRLLDSGKAAQLQAPVYRDLADFTDQLVG
jgi:D-glycero-D-manno-heptose 1,7-bisphosphate phosphatase